MATTTSTPSSSSLTVQHQEQHQQQSTNYNGLPRSVKWRLQLGLLKLQKQQQQSAPPQQQLPQQEACSESSIGDTTSTTCILAKPVVALGDVIQWNSSSLKEELGHYEQLQVTYKDHFLASTATTTAGDGDEVESGENDTTSAINGELVLNNNVAADDDPPQPQATAADAAAGMEMMDPLTAMLMEQQAQEDRRQELELKYRKEKARRKRGLANATTAGGGGGDNYNNNLYVDEGIGVGESTKPVDHGTLDIIDKDLHRLPCPDAINMDNNGITVAWETPDEKLAWMDALREILYIFAQENPHIGYRQGMHEVSSYLWLVLKIDRDLILQQQPPAAEQDGDTTFANLSLLLFGRAAAYRTLQSILSNIRQSFDVKVESNSRPLEEMSSSILAKIHLQHVHFCVHDRLCPLLQSLSVPPQLYCTKWIRLLFSREVVGAQNVVLLWDAFVECVSLGWEWMAVLETAAASRILLCRDQLLEGLHGLSAPSSSALLLSSEIQHQQQEAAHHHHHDAMDLLMNMPPMNDIESLVKQLHQLLQLQKYHPQQNNMPGQQKRSPQSATTSDSNVDAGMLPPNNGSHPPLSTDDPWQYPLSMILHQNEYRQSTIMQQQLQHHHHHRPQRQEQLVGRLGDAFSLGTIRQNLEQGVEKLSSSSDVWRKRLAEEWNGLKQQPLMAGQNNHLTSLLTASQAVVHPSPTTARSYMVDTSLFNDDILSDDDSCNNNIDNHVVLEDVGGIPPNGRKIQHLVGSSPHQQAMQQQQQQQQQPHPLAFGGSYTNGHGHNLSAPAPALSSNNNPATNAFASSTNQIKAQHMVGVQTQLLPTQELAFKLGNSVAVLQDFIMTVSRPPDQQQEEFAFVNPFQQHQQWGIVGPPPSSASTTTKVPNEVWEALADVEAVRTILLQQQQQQQH